MLFRSVGLLEAVSGSGGVSHAPSVLEGADLAVLKHRVAAAKDEVHRPLDEAAGEALAAGLGKPQPVGQEAVVPLNEVGGQGAQKQSVLGGGQAAAIHDEVLGRRNQEKDLNKSQSFGIFVDDPGRVSFDVGETKYDQLVIQAGSDCVIYVIDGEGLKDIVKQFRKLIGQSYLPPKWAFGYQQSRWGYQNEGDVREVVNRHHEQGVPLDAVYLDIDYMENYKDFTVDREKFPEFEAFTGEMKKRGVHLVPIIDAGVKIEKGYSIYEEGVQNDYFCKDENGENFVAAVWPATETICSLVKDV